MYYRVCRFIGEETVSTTKCLLELTNAPTWIIDPIDGTTNFVHSFPLTCISIALSVNKELQLGIVYNPALEQLFTAKKGQGAFLNGKPIKCSNIKGMSWCIRKREFFVFLFIAILKKDLYNSTNSFVTSINKLLIIDRFGTFIAVFGGFLCSNRKYQRYRLG